MARGNGNFVVGLLTGALVGASLAMVLAPAPEEDMRERLRAKAREVGARDPALGFPGNGLPPT